MNTSCKKLPWDFSFEDIDLIKQVNKTNIALGKLEATSLKLPNSKVLIEFLSIKEGVKSNEIENINTTVADAFASELLGREFASFENKETLNYKEAMIQGYQRLKERGGVGYNDFLEINRIITGNSTGIYSSPEKHIKKGSTIIYTPPIGKDIIEDLLKNFELHYNSFSEEKDIDPLLKLPLLHYQFEAIHPFGDGNGRTGRILMILYLVLHKKLSFPILFLSEYINSEKQRYYEYLNTLDTKKELTLKEYTLWLLKGIETYSYETQDVIEKILVIQQGYKNRLKNDPQFQRVYSKDFIDYLFMRPIYSIDSLLMYIPQIRSRQTSSKYLKLLCEKGFIQEYAIWKNKFYYNPEYLDILTGESHHVTENEKR